MLNHESVKHSLGENVRGFAHTNGIESFWLMFKRGFYGTYHKMSKKYLNRYVTVIVKWNNMREDDTLEQMELLVQSMTGKRLTYGKLIG